MAPVDPDPPAGDGSSQTQDQLYDVADRLLALVDQFEYFGYAGLTGDLGSASLRLHWLAGQSLPPEVEAIVADPGQPITVYRVDAAYARAELRARRAMLIMRNENESLDNELCGFLHGFIVPQNGGGLIVQIEPYQTPPDPAAYIMHAESVLSAVAGVPVTVQLGPQGIETASRKDDRSPWKAGARIKSGGSCSSGYGLIIAKKEYMLTANHCFKIGDKVKTGDNQDMGTVTDNKPLLDTEIIEVDKADGKTYLGDVASNVSAAINAEGRNVVGLMACMSGASTGENCSLKVAEVDVTIRRRAILPRRRVVLQESQVYANSTIMRRAGGLSVAIGTGDSGGPAFEPPADKTKNRLAAGIGNAGGNQVPCDRGADTNTCFSFIQYTDMAAILKAYNAKLAP